MRTRNFIRNVKPISYITVEYHRPHRSYNYYYASGPQKDPEPPPLRVILYLSLRLTTKRTDLGSCVCLPLVHRRTSPTNYDYVGGEGGGGHFRRFIILSSCQNFGFVCDLFMNKCPGTVGRVEGGVIVVVVELYSAFYPRRRAGTWWEAEEKKQTKRRRRRKKTNF